MVSDFGATHPYPFQMLVPPPPGCQQMGSTNEIVRWAFPNLTWFIVISRRKISPHGANNNEHELTKNEKQRLQNNVRANFSVYFFMYQRMPNFPRFFPYAGPIRAWWANARSHKFGCNTTPFNCIHVSCRTIKYYMGFPIIMYIDGSNHWVSIIKRVQECSQWECPICIMCSDASFALVAKALTRRRAEGVCVCVDNKKLFN